MKRAKVFVGLSGGVDSSLSALLLKQQGFEVHGLFMKNWEEDDNASFCSAETDLADVRAICNRLDIPLHTINFSQEYWEQVFSYFLDEYKAGRTPNPDILCNKEIKFKAFLDHALKLGADFIATGHYAQSSVCVKTSPDKSLELRRASTYQLLRGKDSNKDQSYFLYTLNQYALSKSLFPVGGLEKPMVRELAKNAGLITHNKKDSTGICFIGERKFKNFLQEFLRDKQGDMLTPEGKKIGQHDGLMYYTLGQRQGLKIGGVKGFAEKPWYVVAKDIDNNILYVSQDGSHPWHQSHVAIANSLNWINPPAFDAFSCSAKVRYRQQDQDCDVFLKNDNAIIRFKTPQLAVTPGQSIVFYQGNICLGGGQLQSTDSQGGILQTRIQVSDREFV